MAQRTPAAKGLAWLVVVIVVIVIVIIVASKSSGPSAHVTGKVDSVVALEGNEVHVYIDWHNSGKGSGSADCSMTTTVHNQFGDEVNIRTNETNTNGKLKPGGTQHLYQDIGVDNGDAQYVTAKDVKLVDC